MFYLCLSFLYLYFTIFLVVIIIIFYLIKCFVAFFFVQWNWKKIKKLKSTTLNKLDTI